MRATHWTKNFLLSNRRHTHEVTKLTIEQRWVNKSSVKDGIKEKKRTSQNCVKRKIIPVYILFCFLLCLLYDVSREKDSRTGLTCLSHALARYVYTSIQYHLRKWHSEYFTHIGFCRCHIRESHVMAFGDGNGAAATVSAVTQTKKKTLRFRRIFGILWFKRVAHLYKSNNALPFLEFPPSLHTYLWYCKRTHSVCVFMLQWNGMKIMPTDMKYNTRKIPW